MATLPLELHEVLEEEYVATYGPLPFGDADAESFLYRANDVLDVRWVRLVLDQCGINWAGREVLDVLNGLVLDGLEQVPHLIQSPLLSAAGTVLLSNAADYGQENSPKFNRRMLDAALRGTVKPLVDARLARLYTALHEKNDDCAPAALCISGGGVRSATFALGVIQGLASAGILKGFHYLSTVSGGGYIGAWLSSWIRRHREGVAGVEADLAFADAGVPGTKDPLANMKVSRETRLHVENAEPAPVRHLRQANELLSPRFRVMSDATWTLCAFYIRAAMLSVIVLAPILAVALAMPRFFSLLLRWVVNQHVRPVIFLQIASVFLAWAFGFVGIARPVLRGDRAEIVRGLSPKTKYLLAFGMPLIGASAALAMFWAAVPKPAELSLSGILRLLGPYANYFAVMAAVTTLIPFAMYYARYMQASAAERGAISRQGAVYLMRKAVAEFVAITVTTAVVAALLIVMAWKLPAGPLYVAFAVPTLLGIFFVHASLFVELSGRVGSERDREWWRRVGAWLLFLAIALAALGAVAVFGPPMLYRAPLVLASVGGLSGAVLALVRFSAKLYDQTSAKGATALRLTLALSAIGFIIIGLSAISLGTTWIVRRFDESAPRPTIQVSGMSVSKTPTQTAAEARTSAHFQTIEATTPLQALCIVLAGYAAFLLSFVIGVNDFSMYSLYRNRLIRAYLSASRYLRDPDRFTDFDEQDNLQMHELRPEVVWTNTLGDGVSLVNRLLECRAERANVVERRIAEEIWSRLGPGSCELMPGREPTGNFRNQLILAINDVLLNVDLTTIAAGTAAGRPNIHRNRKILAAYGFDIGAPALCGPLHVVNTAVTFDSRDIQSFTFTPLHAGSLQLGYRDAQRYGGTEGVSVGTAITISGAGANASISHVLSAPVNFLLRLFNIRLGWWLGNPGIAGGRTFPNPHPWSGVTLLTDEIVGSTNERYPYVYLTDGGRFDNLGLYEMVRRRCRYVVVCDGSLDPEHTYADLGNAIRKVRTDFGIPIEIDQMFMAPRTGNRDLAEGSYVTKGAIRYSATDENGRDGVLIYLKPGLYAGDSFPRDVYSYALTAPDFPHEPTGDRFSSESQFESYRALGRHVVNVICGNYDQGGQPYATRYQSVAQFAQMVRPKLREDAAKTIADAIHGLVRVSS